MMNDEWQHDARRKTPDAIGPGRAGANAFCRPSRTRAKRAARRGSEADAFAPRIAAFAWMAPPGVFLDRRVLQAKVRELGEVRVGGAEDEPVLDGEGGEMGV